MACRPYAILVESLTEMIIEKRVSAFSKYDSDRNYFDAFSE
jgi:hypothetical protein